MPITNLLSTYSYPEGRTNLPIVCVMHGFGGSAYSTSAILERMARYNAFVISPGMRGRNAASGSQDASGREIYDIRDAIEYVKTTYSGIVNPDQVCVVGYSGGGGNALAFACKFPDYAQYIVSFFGISDYGYDATYGWYPNSSATLEAWIGGTPAAVPNAYRARNAVEAIGNFTGGHLWLFHDSGDASVPIHHSTRITDTMDAAGLTNYTENYTGVGDNPRWTHGNPAVGDAGEPCIQSEPIWLQAVVDNDYPAWTVPTSGTLRVIGYCITKRFSIWLGTTTLAGAGGGLDEVATVVYNTATNTYTVTPLTGACDVYINQAGLTGTASGITVETEIVVS